MDIETLKYFQYIAKYRNITEAAKHLYISQSTLSRHIIALENELGVKLFERNNKIVELTEAGKRLYADSSSLIDHLDALINDVVSAGKGLSGIIKLVAPKSLYAFIDEPLNDMRSSYPAVNFFVESYEFSEIPVAVKYKIYNVGFTYDYAWQDSENLTKLPVGYDEFSLIYPRNFDKGNDNDTLKCLLKELPFLLPAYADPEFMPQMISELEKTTGYKISETINLNSTDSVILSVSLGLGYGLIPNSWIELLNESNNIGVINPPGISTTTDVIALFRTDHHSELTSLFLEYLKKYSPLA